MAASSIYTFTTLLFFVFINPLHTALIPIRHKCVLLKGNFTDNLILCGQLSPIQPSIMLNFITSLSSNREPEPFTASWRNKSEKYRHNSFINVVLTVKDVALDRFCMSNCGIDGSCRGSVKGIFISVGNSDTKYRSKLERPGNPLHAALVPKRHDGVLSKGNFTVNLILCGQMAQIQQSIMVNFINFLSSNTAPAPAPITASWRKTSVKFRHSSCINVSFAVDRFCMSKCGTQGSCRGSVKGTFISIGACPSKLGRIGRLFVSGSSFDDKNKSGNGHPVVDEWNQRRGFSFFTRRSILTEAKSHVSPTARHG